MNADANVIIKNKNTGKILTTEKNWIQVELKVTFEGEVVVDGLMVYGKEKIGSLDDWEIIKIDFCF